MSDFVLSLSTRITADENIPALRSAAEVLRRDLRQVCTGYGPENEIVLIQDEACPEEGWRMVVEKRRICLFHRDILGGVFGLLKASETWLGFKPLWFWNDQAIPQQEQVMVPCGTITSQPFAVKHRGWFINDEVLLDPWKKTETEHQEVWRMIFETVLRCGGNMVIPGTDRHGDGLDVMASDMGLTLTQHHAELLGAEMFGRRWPELKGSYRLYPEKFEQLWREAAEKYKGREVIYAIGFRGQGDGPFWGEDNTFDTDEKRGAEVNRIMRRQMEIVRKVEPAAKFCTNLYGEMMHLYRCGALQVPEGVTKIWADNGFGRMLSRRQGSSNPRTDAMPRHEQGRNGIYYHAGFYDLQAANHITQLQVPPTLIANELKQVLANGANDYWIINSGSIKPHIYILDLIREMWTTGHVDVDAHAKAYAQTYFGDERVAALLTGYADCAVKYGGHEDDCAGDQYYHHAARILCTRLMQGNLAADDGLKWAEAADSLSAQARGFADKCALSIPKWEDFIARCDALAAHLSPEAAQLLRATLRMNAMVHLSGCRILGLMGELFAAWENQRFDEAFLLAGDAWEEAKNGYARLRGAEQGKWENFYGNDCFVNLHLTAETLHRLQGWIRVTKDGPHFWDWERKWLMDPREVRICLQTHRHCQYTDDELYARMKAISCERRKL